MGHMIPLVACPEVKNIVILFLLEK